MIFEQILDRFEGVQARWGYVMARCPAHEDRVRSLRIKEGNWRAFVDCFAGCTEEEILEAAGLTSQDLRLEELPEPGVLTDPQTRPLSARGEAGEGGPKRKPGRSSGSGNTRPADLSRFTETYEYVSDVGEVLYVVCRTEDKDFFQATPSSDSPTSYIWGRRARPVLYRLPQVLEAVEQGEDIYVVEGEKDVHAIESLGAVATCNPGGASKGQTKWKDSYTECLRGAYVTIVSDVDEAGKAHAEQIADALSPVADVSLVFPKVGKDAHDHIEAGYGLDDFLERLRVH